MTVNETEARTGIEEAKPRLGPKHPYERELELLSSCLQPQEQVKLRVGLKEPKGALLVVTTQRVLIISVQRRLSAGTDIAFDLSGITTICLLPDGKAAFCVRGESLVITFKSEGDQLPVCDYIRFLAPSPKTTLTDASGTASVTTTETGGGWFVGVGF